MSESRTVDEEHDLERDIAETVRTAILLALAALNAYILWSEVKDRPEVLVLRQRIRDATLGPWRRWQEVRKAEKHVVWEAIEVVGEEKEETA